MPLRWGPKMSIFLFLTTAILLLPLSPTLASIDNDYIDNKTKGDDEGNGFALDLEESTLDGEWAKEVIAIKRTTATVNTFDPTHNLPELLTSMRSKESRNRIWIVLAYRESCEQSMELKRKLSHRVIPRLNFDYDNDADSGSLNRPEINFVPMTIDDDGIGVELKEKILHRLGIIRLPSLFFLRDEAKQVDRTLNLEDVFSSSEVYRGRSDSISDLVDGLYHYLARLRLQPASALKTQEHQQFVDRGLPLTVIRVNSLQDLLEIIRGKNQKDLFQRPPLPLDPDLSDDDDRWIRYLMDDDCGINNSSPDTRIFNVDMIDDKNDYEKHKGGYGDQKESRSRRQSDTEETYHIVVQCRNMMGGRSKSENQDKVDGANSFFRQTSLQHSITQRYQEYDQVTKVLGARRDIFFSILEPLSFDQSSSPYSFCNSSSDDGLVKIWDFQLGSVLVEDRVDEESKEGEGYIIGTASILDSLSCHLRPEVLWFDRRMTAPIAFHPRYHRHAILFVDIYDRTSGELTREIIRLFRHECRQIQKEYKLKLMNSNSTLNQSAERVAGGEDRENGVVCLVVPNTEIRVLNTFGIDIWSHLDRQAIDKIKSTVYQNHDRDGNEFEGEAKNQRRKDTNVLPSLLITDRQKDGTIQRHYLDPPITQRSISNFFKEFVNGRSIPEKKSRHTSVDIHFDEDGRQIFPKNKYFIKMLTAESLPHFLEAKREKHVLVQLYAPTCGHCKRFNVIWNSLGELINYLGWSDKLILARVDVTSNEIIVPGMTTAWLPDLFYFGVGISENPIHYGKSPIADEVELGSISDPLDLLEWWMDEAGTAIDEAELLNDIATNSNSK